MNSTYLQPYLSSQTDSNLIPIPFDPYPTKKFRKKRDPGDYLKRTGQSIAENTINGNNVAANRDSMHRNYHVTTSQISATILTHRPFAHRPSNCKKLSYRVPHCNKTCFGMGELAWIQILIQKIPMMVEGFEPPHEEVILIRRPSNCKKLSYRVPHCNKTCFGMGELAWIQILISKWLELVRACKIVQIMSFAADSSGDDESVVSDRESILTGNRVENMFCTSLFSQAKVAAFRYMQRRLGRKMVVKYGWFGGCSKQEIDRIVVFRFGYADVGNCEGFGNAVVLNADHSPFESVESTIVDDDGVKHILLCFKTQRIANRPQVNGVRLEKPISSRIPIPDHIAKLSNMLPPKSIKEIT
nr:hypothetical protein [Tanacetum cinerariifolium]